MRVIVGLGNPGRKYARTRHNAGFLAADFLVARWRLAPEHWKSDAEAAIGLVGEERVRVLKPLTYMNRSGDALDFLRYGNLDPARDLLIMTDDFALPLGDIRLRARGSSGGHNGLESVRTALGSDGYARLRIGVGPLPPGTRDWAEFVLGPWTPEQGEQLTKVMPLAADAVECWIREGIEPAMSRFNRRNRGGPSAEGEAGVDSGS